MALVSGIVRKRAKTFDTCAYYCTQSGQIVCEVLIKHKYHFDISIFLIRQSCKHETATRFSKVCRYILSDRNVISKQKLSHFVLLQWTGVESCTYQDWGGI